MRLVLFYFIKIAQNSIIIRIILRGRWLDEDNNYLQKLC